MTKQLLLIFIIFLFLNYQTLHYIFSFKIHLFLTFRTDIAHPLNTHYTSGAKSGSQLDFISIRILTEINPQSYKEDRWICPQ